MKIINKSVVAAAIAAAMGTAVTPMTASAAVIEMDWTGWFTMLDSVGNAFANSSLSNRGEQGRTPISGTMTFNTLTGAGSGTVATFDFFGNNGLGAAGAAEAAGITFQAIGDGNCTMTGCGEGSLILGNMLFNWGGNNGIPVSIVLDAAGMFGAMMDPGFGVGTVIAGVGALPAAEGTYGTKGFMNYGPSPVATTTWDTSLAPGCSVGACMSVSPSGVLPLIADTRLNENLSYGGPDVFGIGGSPMVDGPFPNNSANFDVSSITITSIDPGTTVIPVPAAVWLLGSGLIGLVGVARRRKTA